MYAVTTAERPKSELLKYSFDSVSEHRNLIGSTPKEIARQLTLSREAYVAEVVADEVCSPIYPLYFDGPIAYTTPEKKPKDRMDQQFDPDERDGVPLLGFNRFSRQMREHPGEVVLWYSRRGPAAFHENAGVFSQMTFNDDQCYAGIYHDGDNTSLVTAIKANSDEGTVQFFPEQFKVADDNKFSEKEMIMYALATPRTTGMSLEEFIGQNCERETLIYTDKDGKAHTVGDMLDAVADAFHKHHTVDITKSETYQKLYIDAHNGLIDMRHIRNMYVGAILEDMSRKGETEKVLGGSCGGSTVTLDELDDLVSPLEAFMSNLSSSFRIATQGNALTKDSSRKLTAEEAKNAEGVCKCGKPHEAHFHCPDDNTAILIGKGINKCPGCGKDGTCK